MFTREQFYKYRDYHPTWGNWTYSDYLIWAHKKEKESLRRKLEAAAVLVSLVIGFILGAWLL